MTLETNKKTPGIKTPKDPTQSRFTVPDGLWVRCHECHAILEQGRLEENVQVCTECGHHFRVGSRKRIQTFCDADSFQEIDQDLVPRDILHFYDSKGYEERLKSAQAAKNMPDAFVSGRAKLNGVSILVGAFEFGFMGGSMGTIVGEKASRLFDLGAKENTPVIIFHASGGARMQEGLLSLMQMGKTVMALTQLNKKGVPYISVLSDPTTGGVAASFAILGDVNIAEPKALIGFAGPRVIEQTMKQKLPEGFQRSEFLLEKGMVDQVVHRKDLRSVIERYIRLLTK